MAAFWCSERQLLLRVVGCLPSAAGLLALTDAQWAGVGQAAREETAGCFAVVKAGRWAMGI